MQDKKTFPDSASMDAPGTMKYDGSHKLRLISIGADSTCRGRFRRGRALSSWQESAAKFSARAKIGTPRGRAWILSGQLGSELAVYQTVISPMWTGSMLVNLMSRTIRMLLHIFA